MKWLIFGLFLLALWFVGGFGLVALFLAVWALMEATWTRLRR